MEIGMVFKDYSGRISSMDFHRTSGYLVTASEDESIRLYDVSSATCLKTINSKKYGVDLVCFTSHPTTVIYSSKNGWDESLRLLSLHDNKYLRYFKGHHDRVVSLSLNARNESFISGSLDRTVLLWDQRAEKCQGLLRVQGRPAISYDDQGLVFAIAFGGYIRMFDARMYEKGPFEIFSVGGDVSDANVVKFSNDGRLMLLTTMDGHIHVLDSFRGTHLSTYNVKPVPSNCTLEASFSPEGMFVISGILYPNAKYPTVQGMVVHMLGVYAVEKKKGNTHYHNDILRHCTELEMLNVVDPWNVVMSGLSDLAAKNTRGNPQKIQ
ncbi:hypothetical protein Golob_022511 [Gossypium lobatum]|uniref:Uncharacterized protein n=1 Tax=Gossypium lobatum TaxID=34289 RepID=A0A7J8LGR2_9ROSI|nr:hypothetical protein [Gossypium lobatum]